MPRKDCSRLSALPTRADRVRVQLAAEIIAGQHRAGTRLDEVAQSSRLGVSRTPLREAVRQLASMGLVENRPHRGVVVAERARQALFESLAEMEAILARLAAIRMGAEERAELVRLAEVGGDWLGAVHRGSANAVLGGMAETLWQPLSVGAVMEGGGDLGRRVAVAIAAGRGMEADAAMRDYVRAAASAFTPARHARRTVETRVQGVA